MVHSLKKQFHIWKIGSLYLPLPPPESQAFQRGRDIANLSFPSEDFSAQLRENECHYHAQKLKIPHHVSPPPNPSENLRRPPASSILLITDCYPKSSDRLLLLPRKGLKIPTPQ